MLGDFDEFMQKMDSIENVALISALIKVKNKEDLSSFLAKNTVTAKEQTASLKTKEAHETPATYPGGINQLRKEIAKLFYFDANLSEDEKKLSTELFFIVEKSGYISNVKAIGDNSVFNRQAEIALYSVENKFEPATLNGQTVRYRFKLPLTMNFGD